MVLFVHYTGDYKTAYNNIGASVFVYSLGVFSAINNIKINFKEKTIRIIVRLSKLTFGVYIIHVMVLSVFDKLLPYSGHSAIYTFLFYNRGFCFFYRLIYLFENTYIKECYKGIN